MSQGPLHLYVDSLFTSPYAMSVFVALREKAWRSRPSPWTSMPGKPRRQITPNAP